MFKPMTLPCGAVLKNRIIKSAMSDSLGDGYGNPTKTQIRLYEKWAEGGVAASIVGEVQGDPYFAEKPGNLVLDDASDSLLFENLATAGAQHGSFLWLQLGHAGAMARRSSTSAYNLSVRFTLQDLSEAVAASTRVAR